MRSKRGKKLARVNGPATRQLIFRNMFIDERDAEIARVLWNYFGAVATRWPNAWPERVKGNILNRTTGFGALMRFLRIGFLRYEKPESVPSTNYFLDIFKKVQLSDSDFTPENYKPGSSGEKDLYLALLAQSELPEYS